METSSSHSKLITLTNAEIAITDIRPTQSKLPRFVALQEVLPPTPDIAQPARIFKAPSRPAPRSKRHAKSKKFKKVRPGPGTMDMSETAAASEQNEILADQVDAGKNLGCPPSSSSIPTDDGEFEMLQVKYKSHSKMIENMTNRSFMCTDFSDVQLICGTEVFFGHKLILASASEHFDLLLSKVAYPGVNQILTIVGVKVPTFKSLMEFMYKGTTSVRHEDINEFLRIGNEFRIRGLYSREQNESSSMSTLESENSEPRGENGGGPNCSETDLFSFEDFAGSNDSRTVTATSDLSGEEGRYFLIIYFFKDSQRFVINRNHFMTR